ncbi:hypothetical protein V1478_008722 [Vespula squamosa]|uniref:Uncharacterized protein n=1 Tax=Vespula squamosa TaxID=30214 RepID=A0ABD2AUC1_VESSQ
MQTKLNPWALVPLALIKLRSPNDSLPGTSIVVREGTFLYLETTNANTKAELSILDIRNMSMVIGGCHAIGYEKANRNGDTRSQHPRIQTRALEFSLKGDNPMRSRETRV